MHFLHGMPLSRYGAARALVAVLAGAVD